jgi:hypothetical protein
VNLLDTMKFSLKGLGNVHRPGPQPDIFLFATPRGGSTWVMEIIAADVGMKFFDEPLNVRRRNVMYSGLFPTWESLMPDSGDTDRIIGFLQELQKGRCSYMNMTPFRRNYRPITNRIVFKIHEIEHLIDVVAERCGGQIVQLHRHPIPTSFSRHALPRLELFTKSDYYASVIGDSTRNAEIRRIAAQGSDFERSIVSWCYENVVALRKSNPAWLTVAYEELVLNPQPSANLLADRLHLRDRQAVLNAFERPAANISMSHQQTLEAMNNPDARRRRYQLVTKWQKSVTPEQLDQAARILGLFEISAYDARQPLPGRKLLHFDDTEQLFRDAAPSRHPN